ncbi:hypothetical protein ABMA28_014043 [Loxostege sticticalis]|uniref:SLC26A/SulP transporter domain-containing protein n=1 Tax=Loxostege sticticalis TaxID=481309 RepID=A0ABD0TFC7_LOXSC
MDVPSTIRRRLKNSAKEACSYKTIKKRLPILQWLPKYSSDYLIKDTIAGVTVGLTAIPQGIAYAVIAGLPPEYGMYASLTSGFVYIIFGSCKDVTVGPTAIIASMIAKYASCSIDYAVLAGFLTGVIILLMGIFRLGFLVNFISMPVISGFTTAAALQIAASQLKGFFALKGPSGNIFYESVYNLFKNIKTAKIWDPVLGTSTIIMLYILKRMGQGCKSTGGVQKVTRWFLSLARNAVVVVFGMILAYVFQITTFHVPFELIGNIGSGLPAISLPPFSTVTNNQTVPFVEMLQVLGPQFLVVPFVATLKTVTISKAFAEGGRVDATQEMIAVGLCNIIGSFAQSMPITGSSTKTALNYASGVQTPAGGVTKCVFIILALSFLTTTFKYIPKASLAGLILMEMFSMIDYEMIFKLWRKSKKEFILLVMTLIVCLFAGLEYGIVTGILLEGVMLLYTTSVPTVYISSIKVDNRDFVNLHLLDNVPYCASEYIKKAVFKASHQADVLIIDGTDLHRMDFTVASNLMILVKDLNKVNKDIVFFNFKESFRNLCVDIYPEAESKFRPALTELDKSLPVKYITHL